MKEPNFGNYSKKYKNAFGELEKTLEECKNENILAGLHSMPFVDYLSRSLVKRVNEEVINEIRNSAGKGEKREIDKFIKTQKIGDGFDYGFASRVSAAVSTGKSSMIPKFDLIQRYCVSNGLEECVSVKDWLSVLKEILENYKDDWFEKSGGYTKTKHLRNKKYKTIAMHVVSNNGLIGESDENLKNSVSNYSNNQNKYLSTVFVPCYSDSYNLSLIKAEKKLRFIAEGEEFFKYINKKNQDKNKTNKRIIAVDEAVKTLKDNIEAVNPMNGNIYNIREQMLSVFNVFVKNNKDLSNEELKTFLNKAIEKNKNFFKYLCPYHFFNKATNLGVDRVFLVVSSIKAEYPLTYFKVEKKKIVKEVRGLSSLIREVKDGTKLELKEGYEKGYDVYVFVDEEEKIKKMNMENFIKSYSMHDFKEPFNNLCHSLLSNSCMFAILELFDIQNNFKNTDKRDQVLKSITTNITKQKIEDLEGELRKEVDKKKKEEGVVMPSDLNEIVRSVFVEFVEKERKVDQSEAEDIVESIEENLKKSENGSIDVLKILYSTVCFLSSFAQFGSSGVFDKFELFSIPFKLTKSEREEDLRVIGKIEGRSGIKSVFASGYNITNIDSELENLYIQIHTSEGGSKAYLRVKKENSKGIMVMEKDIDGKKSLEIKEYLKDSAMFLNCINIFALKLNPLKASVNGDVNKIFRNLDLPNYQKDYDLKSLELNLNNNNQNKYQNEVDKLGSFYLKGSITTEIKIGKSNIENGGEHEVYANVLVKTPEFLYMELVKMGIPVWLMSGTNPFAEEASALFFNEEVINEIDYNPKNQNKNKKEKTWKRRVKRKTTEMYSRIMNDTQLRVLEILRRKNLKYNESREYEYSPLWLRIDNENQELLSTVGQKRYLSSGEEKTSIRRSIVFAEAIKGNKEMIKRDRKKTMGLFFSQTNFDKIEEQLRDGIIENLSFINAENKIERLCNDLSEENKEKYMTRFNGDGSKKSQLIKKLQDDLLIINYQDTKVVVFSLKASNKKNKKSLFSFMSDLTEAYKQDTGVDMLFIVATSFNSSGTGENHVFEANGRDQNFPLLIHSDRLWYHRLRDEINLHKEDYVYEDEIQKKNDIKRSGVIRIMRMEARLIADAKSGSKVNNSDEILTAEELDDYWFAETFANFFQTDGRQSRIWDNEDSKPITFVSTEVIDALIRRGNYEDIFKRMAGFLSYQNSEKQKVLLEVLKSKFEKNEKIKTTEEDIEKYNHDSYESFREDCMDQIKRKGSVEYKKTKKRHAGVRTKGLMTALFRANDTFEDIQKTMEGIHRSEFKNYKAKNTLFSDKELSDHANALVNFRTVKSTLNALSKSKYKNKEILDDWKELSNSNFRVFPEFKNLTETTMKGYFGEMLFDLCLAEELLSRGYEDFSKEELQKEPYGNFNGERRNVEFFVEQEGFEDYFDEKQQGLFEYADFMYINKDKKKILFVDAKLMQYNKDDKFKFIKEQNGKLNTLKKSLQNYGKGYKVDYWTVNMIVDDNISVEDLHKGTQMKKSKVSFLQGLDKNGELTTTIKSKLNKL